MRCQAKLFSLISMALLAGLFLTAPVHAAVDWDVKATYQTDSPPLDIASSVDGKWSFVLTKGGKLYIFTSGGILNDTIQVDQSMDRISSSGLPPAGIPEKIYLSSSTTNQVQEISIEFSVDNIDIQGSPFLGPPDAKVLIVEFSDFECPYCGQVRPLFEEILTRYPEQVKVVFKQFPLSFHKKARPAAMAALAAHRQGKFWQYHDLLFENQKSLSEAKFIELASQLQLDMEKFNRDRKSGELKQDIESDIAEAKKAGVRGTPSIFINGRKLKQRSVAELERMIKEELAKQQAAQ